ncbi:MAG: hypothetical protein ACM3ZC_01060 [Bacteroidota bacterium]
MSVTFESKQSNDLLHFKVSGFAPYHQIKEVVEKVKTEINKAEEKGRPYRILFDLRGLKALDPRAVAEIEKLDKIIIGLTKLVKVGTVLDSIIAKIQQMRVAKNYDMLNGDFFSDFDECMAWLNDPITDKREYRRKVESRKKN